MEKLPPMLQELMLMLDAGLAAVAMADEVPHSFSKSARRRQFKKTSIIYYSFFRCI